VGRYSTQRSVLTPTVMLERWADELVLYRRDKANGVEPDDSRLVKTIHEMRACSDSKWWRGG
jgi:hypothetical protein